MKDMFLDSVEIIPEARRIRRRHGGFFRKLIRFIGGLIMSYFMVILFILAIILLPFILLRNRRAGNNDVFLNDEEDIWFAGSYSIYFCFYGMCYNKNKRLWNKRPEL